MIAITFMYPYGEGKKFDMDYYLNVHVPSVSDYIPPEVNALIKGRSVIQGLSGGAPGTSPAYFAMTQVLFESQEDLMKYLRAMSGRPSDLAEYADIPPIVLVGEVKLT